MAIAAVVGLMLIAAACGGGSSTTTAGATATTGGDQQSSRQAYTDCLAQNGVTLPQRGQGNGQGNGQGGPSGSFDPANPPANRGTLPPGVDQATMDKARTACQSLRPAGGFGGGGGGGTAFQAYASCMKDHGVTLPSRGGSSTDTSTPPPSIDRNSAAFQTANDACKALLPAQGQGGSTTSTTATS